MQTGKPKKDGQVGQAGQDGAPAQTGTRRTKLYDVSQVGDRFDKLRSSNLRPLDATVHAMRDRIVDCFADGYSITDVIELLQQSGIDGTDRQIRYALDRAGIHRRQVRRGRSSTNRRQAGQTGADSRTAESGANVQEDGQPDASEDVHAVQNSNERSSEDPQTPSSADSGNAQADGPFGPAETQSTPRADRQSRQADSSSSPAVPQVPARPAVNGAQASPASNAQAEQNLTPEEQAELMEFDSAGNDEF